MRNFGIALIAIASLAFATPVFAFGNDDHSTNQTANPTAVSGSAANGTGVGVGIAGGGDANANASGGNAGAVSGSLSGADATAINGPNTAITGPSTSGAAAFSGVDFEDSAFGNSRNSNTLTGEQDQHQGQGQMQGQLNAQGQLNTQGQDTDQANSQNTNIDASDRSTTVVEASDIPVASAAPVFASACSAGVSGQSFGFGGSLATTNPMCDMALAAEMAKAVGNDELAIELTEEAAAFARARTNVVRRFGQWIPFFGQLF